MKKGFTLVELLVVVAILGILAAVGIVSFGGFLGSAKENTVKANHVNIIKFCQSQIMKCTLGANSVVLKDKNGDEVSNDCPFGVAACINHFEGDGWHNVFVPSRLAVSMGTECPTQIGQTEIGNVNNNSIHVAIFICTKWGEGENDIITNTVSID